MRLKIITSMAGNGYVHNPGDVVEFKKAEAQRLIEAGYAKPIKSSKPIETAEQPQASNAETTDLPEAKRKRRNKQGA